MVREKKGMKILKTIIKKGAVAKSDLDSLKTAMHNAKIDYFDFNIDTGADYHTNEISKQLGYALSEVETFEQRSKQIHDEDVAYALNEIQRLINGEISILKIEYRSMAKDGTYIWISHIGSIRVNQDTNEKHYIGILRDITKEKENLTFLDYSLMYDGLTNAYSRKYGLTKLNNLFSKEKQIAVAYIDVDNLKETNDAYGHSEGDELLKTLVKHTKIKIRDNDFVVRMGGDEFLIVFENINTEDLVKKMSAFNIDGINFSYGISDITERFLTVNDLIQAADARMYEHKKTKK